jgi:hypothetical protein
VAIVEMVAGCGEARDVTAAGYRDLHERLLAACRSELEAAAGPRRALLERLEALAEPWLSPHALASMDPEALASLVLRCRQLGRDLGAAGHGPALGRWVALFATLFLGVALAGWACRQQAWMVRARAWTAALWPLAQHHPLMATGALLTAVLLAALWLVPRLLRG